jgi:DNA-binding NtrC family response regulator
LLYRLNVLSLTIPALRDRATDIVELATHFVGVYAKEHGRLTPQLGDDALSKLSQHSWPGNVRELEGVIQRAIVLRDSEVLTATDLDIADSGDLNLAQGDLFRLGKSRAIVQFERNFIARLLAAHGGNISRAAKAAGKDRRSFQRLISKYSLDRKAFEPQLL